MPNSVMNNTPSTPLNASPLNGKHPSNNKFIPDPRTVAVLGVAFCGGQARGGVEMGPQTLAEFGIHQQLRDLDWKVSVDSRCLNVTQFQPKSDPPIGKLKNPRYVSKVCEHVSTLVEEHARSGKFVLTIGGDHSLGMATISGTSRVYNNMCVVWVDAHSDINTPLSTESGNIHGCPVSFLMGLPGTETVDEFKWCVPCLQPSQIVYIGLRDVDVGEKRILKQFGIKCFSMTDVDRFGIGKVVELALDHVNPNRDLPIHLSYDVDALDPSVAPATGTPVRGGLTFREGHYICEALHETGLLCAMDLVEVNPELANGDVSHLNQTVAVGCSLIRSALGETLL